MTNFEKSLKPRSVEEWLDYYFYRRVAHFLVPLFIKLKFSPNQISTLSMLTGFLAAYMVLRHHFILSALLVMLTIVFDCSDGQVARLTGQTSPLGRIVDGACDFFWVLSYWLGIYFSGYFQAHNLPVLYLMIVSGAGVAIHCWRYDAAKILYQGFLADQPETPMNQDDARRIIKQSAQKWDVVGTFLGMCMFIQLYFVNDSMAQTRHVAYSPEAREKIKEVLEPMMRSWTWMGESHHNTALLIGVLCMAFSPYPLIAIFIYILVPLNLWYFSLEYRWGKAVKQIKDTIT
ncbi:CDP-alcohol phosphatidyltransferase family protein [bacterium]|nr:CDP-alcohol phosphatidyltransferase family protein [bacterium]